MKLTTRNTARRRRILPRRRTTTTILFPLLLILAYTTDPTTATLLKSSQPPSTDLATSLTSSPIPSGQIDDATCDVEQLEEANDRQLYVILKDLKNTTFFKNFAVDLDETCPLKTWGKVKKERPGDGDHAVPAKKVTKNTVKKDDEGTFGGSSSGTSSIGGFSSAMMGDSNDNDDDGGHFCASEGLPDAEPMVKPACAIESDTDDVPFLSSSFGGGMSMSDSSSSSLSGNENEKDEIDIKTTTATDNDNEDDFECDGGNVSDEMEEDAPPLCELTEEEIDEYYTEHNPSQSTTPVHDLLSSALNSINKKLGWDSESEKRTFTWSNPSDPVVLSNEDPCDDDESIINTKDGKTTKKAHTQSQQHHHSLLPETFWMDMCSNITEGEGLKLVNLALNPERNTGYNGTHIWNAIYEENCIALDGVTDQPMCYEERILYRLLSGLHASTTLSIAKNYYPPNARKGRVGWTSNPEYFWEKFGENPEYIHNLHFSYVVLLRALKKAGSFLYNYEIKTGNIVDDETATILLRRLLDTSILKSCNGVFTAFDESLMFQQQSIFDSSEKLVSLQQNFKGVFHNISSILDCVQCQQCKLHGKMAMLGYGTALKILFLPNEDLIASSLSRNEIVAFINTIAKMSEAMLEVRELTTMYWSKQLEKKKPKDALPSPLPESGLDPSGSDLLDSAVGIAAKLQREGMISDDLEVELVKLALMHDQNLMVLVKYYSSDLGKFLVHAKNLPQLANSMDIQAESHEPDAIVVGTGLAGLAATLNILDRGGKVVLIEKEHLLGGNSNKASSGVNACCPNNETYTGDVESFKADTLKSAGDAAQPALIDVLIENSESAVNWLKERVGVDLSLVAQLGGHQYKRTHRPSNGMVGAEVIYGMQKAVKKYQKSGMVEIILDTQVKSLLTDETGRVTGIEAEQLSNDGKDLIQLNAPNVILATGGFAADRSDDSYLSKYRPELLKMPATAGNFSTGDGISLATVVGADLVDMDKVQIHPTGWVNPQDPNNPNKVLAAELMRGVGGVLINIAGQRFCNELGTRAYVTDMMLGHDPVYAETKKWNKENEIPTFSLVLSSSAAEDGKKHVDHYTHKGLLKRLEGVSALAEWMGLDVDVVRQTLVEYQLNAKSEEDQWGKPSFRGVPKQDLDQEVFYAGTVTPVLHYCMGGITIDTEGNVLDKDRKPIPGLHAAGEVTGGVHGNNRLGGNSLLECTVYGTIVGKKIPIGTKSKPLKNIAISPQQEPITETKEREVTKEELAIHNTPDDCWVAIHGYVYDLTEFADEHPAGAESIHELAGQDGTEAFAAIHNKNLMDDFDEDLIGVFV